MVDAVLFSGAIGLSAGQLADVIATERTGLWRRWFGWNTGPLTCLDSIEAVRDATRLAEEYAVRGYPGTTVSAGITRRGDRRAQVRFTVKESAPIRIASVSFSGLPPAVVDVGALQRLMRNQPLDSTLLSTVRDSVQLLLRAAGYARAGAPDGPTIALDSGSREAVVSYRFTPGRVVGVGAITVRVTPTGRKPALDSSDIRALLRVRPGSPFSSRLLSASQRELYGLELYRTIRIDNAPYDSVNNLIPLNVSLVEGPRWRLRGGGGWGTLDCFRTQLRVVDQNLLSSGHRLELNGRLSKIGVADPLGGFSGLCTPGLRDDVFSTHLNYYAGASLNLRGVVGSRLHPAFTVYSERRSEYKVYEQTTEIGVVTSVSREVAPRTSASLQYQFVNARTVADGAVSCERFGFCRVEDLASFRLASPIHTLSAVVARNPLTPVDDPTLGYRWQLEAREGYTDVARTIPLHFTRLVGEAAGYVPLGSLVTLAVRAQLGFVRAPSDVSTLLPPSERFYSGGQSSVRGYDQNQLGPGSYIVDKYVEKTLPDSSIVGVVTADARSRPAPSGGNAMWLANIELRTRHGWPAEPLRWVVFIDAGRVWNTNDVFSSLNADARITPGFGLRLATPLGPFRMDIGYNAYAPEPGPAFYIQAADATTGKVGRAICVSPSSTDPLTLAAGQRGSLLCPATYTPASRSGFSRLAFHFSIGNAF